MKTIPVEENPGGAPQGDGRGGMAAIGHRFHLRTTEFLYPAPSDTVEALEALGFDFSANGAPHHVTKIGNPPPPYEIYDVAHLMQFIAKHGPVAITGDGELFIMGGHAHYLKTLAACGTKMEGYTSLSYEPTAPKG